MKRIYEEPKVFSHSPHGKEAFTKLELLSILGTLALIIGVALPALTQNRPQSLQAICANNLRQIGQAFSVFNAENGQRDPWRTPSRNGGIANNAWFQVMSLSNDLPNPSVLACPSDTSVRPAKNYGFGSNGGLLHPSYQNGAISYALGLDSSALRPNSVLSADRNLKYAGLSVGCSSGINPAATIEIGGDASTGWREGLHGPAGNLLLHDGRVESTSSKSVNGWFRVGDDRGATHFLSPRGS